MVECGQRKEGRRPKREGDIRGEMGSEDQKPGIGNPSRFLRKGGEGTGDGAEQGKQK